MIDHLAARLLLRNKMLEASASLPTAIEYENRPITPPTPTHTPPTIADCWLRETYLKGDDTPITFGSPLLVLECIGIYQVDVFTPKNSGDELARTIAGVIVNKFPVHLPVGGIVITKATALPGQMEETSLWYHTPVLVYFRAYGTSA